MKVRKNVVNNAVNLRRSSAEPSQNLNFITAQDIAYSNSPESKKKLAGSTSLPNLHDKNDKFNINKRLAEKLNFMTQQSAMY